MPSSGEYLTFAVKLARQAGQLMRDGQSGCLVRTKDDSTVVTEVDHRVNNMVITEVRKAYPDHGVLGEEVSHESDSGLQWVCDPIDGTVAYIIGLPVSAFSLALVKEGEPIVAVIYNPWTDQMYTAVKNEGAWCGKVRLRVSLAGKKPADKVLITGKGMDAFTGLFGSRRAQQLLLDKPNWHLVHCLGIAYRGCLIAQGSLHGTLYSHTHAHDIAALHLIVTEAGGKVTDLHGNQQRYDQPIKGAIVSNGVIHDELTELTTQLRRQLRERDT